jgi:MFS family permease
MLMIGLLLSMLGAAMVAFAALQKSFALMFLGRAVFGIGSESAFVTRNSCCLDYFTDEVGAKHLAFAMAMTVVSGRLGTLLMFTTTSLVVEYIGNYTAALWYGLLWCLVSLAVSVALSAGGSVSCVM